MKNSILLAAAALALGALPTQATVYSFTNGGGDNAYKNALNWSGGVIPNTSAGDTAKIANGSAVTYTPGGDLTLANGGVLEISNGSFTQVVSNNWLQLNGGTVLVDGGTFNQGTAGSNPFNLTGTNNFFTVSSGAANISTNFNLSTGYTFLQTGGVVNVLGNETDFNSITATLAGGILNTNLITGVNGGPSSRFDISGGTLNLTGNGGNNGIYGGGLTNYINFTLGSTGQITFSDGTATISAVQGMVNTGVIQYNSGGTGTISHFSITSNGGVVTLAAVVPEPSSVAAAIGLGCLGLVVLRRRRMAQM